MVGKGTSPTRAWFPSSERYGEVVAAFVVRQKGGKGAVEAEEIREWVRTRLSHHLGEFPSSLEEMIW